MAIELGLAVMAGLTPNQTEATEYRGQDACVVAGPGSGKTTVLVERYRRLIVDHGFDTRQILAITFTEKAAANMKAKLAAQFEHHPVMLRELETAWVSTIHGFCARLLRENAIAAGIDPRYRVLDARESDDLQYECLNGALDELVSQRRGEALDLIEALDIPYIAGDLKNAYDAIRSAGKTVAEIRAMPNPGSAASPREFALRLEKLLEHWPVFLTEARRRQRSELSAWAGRLARADAGDAAGMIQLFEDFPLRLGSVPETEKDALKTFREDLQSLRASAVDRRTTSFRALIFEALSRFEALCIERKTAAGTLDFSDLERRTIELLRRDSAVRHRIRSQFRQVMLDEFQDINQQQDELMELVCGDDVFFAVGDRNQSIYGFRHARPEIFRRYRAEIEAAGKHFTELLDNFRSRAEILRCVEALLNPREGIEARELVAASEFDDKPEPSVEVIRVQAADREEGPALEARWIAHRILSLRGELNLTPGRRADFSDFAVLCRNGDSMKPILEAFDDAGIPYVCGRRQSFLLSREGRDIRALLQTIANPRDSIALATVLRSPLVGIGDESLLHMRLLAASLTGGLNMLARDNGRLAEFAAEEAAKLERFARNLKRWRAEQPVLPLDVFLARALAGCGFEWVPGTRRGNDVESFLRLARTRGEDGGLNRFLRELESLENAISTESDLADEDQGNCVQVMTAHAAKGLEFPVTIIAAMDKGTQRNTAPVTFSPDYGLGIKWSEGPDSWHLHNNRYLDERDKDESDRLLYVAMTRAKEHLILSYSCGERRPSNWAKIIEEHFRVDSFPPSGEPRELIAHGPNEVEFTVRVINADTNPPALAYAGESSNEAAVVTIHRPAALDHHDSVVNVTSLAVFASCPRKYYIQRYIGWGGASEPGAFEGGGEDEARAGVPAAELGSMVHEILAGTSGSYPPAAHQLADTFLTSELGARAAAAQRSAREWEFIVDVDGMLVRGMVDLWFEEAGELFIVDYKTDDVTASQIGERAAEYEPQLALYGLALERAFGHRPARAYLHFLRPDSIVEITLDDGAVRGVRDLISRLRSAQNSLTFELREGKHCGSCPFHHGLCPAA